MERKNNTVTIILMVLIFFVLFIIIIGITMRECRREGYSDDKRIKAYCINRLERPDRLRKFQNLVRENNNYRNLDIEIVPAVEKKNLLPFFNVKFPMGALGCSLSHLRCLLSFLALKNEEHCVIFEDDAVCSNKVGDIIHIINEYSKKYDILILGYNYIHDNDKKLVCEKNERLNISICEDFEKIYGSHSYIVNKKAANYLVSKLLPIKIPYDIFFSNDEIKKNLSVALVKDNICKAADLSDSNTITS